MPTDTFTADALAIRDAGGPWPFGVGGTTFKIDTNRQDKFLYACVEWLVRRNGWTIEHGERHASANRSILRMPGLADFRWKVLFKMADGTMTQLRYDTLPEAIIAAVKAELGIK